MTSSGSDDTGQALFFGSAGLLAYAACVALGFHLFVVLWEEPHLREKFGAEYDEYFRRVPRWIPGLRPRQPTDRTRDAGGIRPE